MQSERQGFIRHFFNRLQPIAANTVQKQILGLSECTGRQLSKQHSPMSLDGYHFGHLQARFITKRNPHPLRRFVK